MKKHYKIIKNVWKTQTGCSGQHSLFLTLIFNTRTLLPCNMSHCICDHAIWEQLQPQYLCERGSAKFYLILTKVFFYVVPLSQKPPAKEALLHHCYPVIINSSCCNIMLCFLRPVRSALELRGVGNCRTPLQFCFGFFWKWIYVFFFFNFIMELYNRYTFGFCVRFHENRHKFACLISAENFISSN